jgi:phosphotransferase system HPr (HPr) family protein
MPETLKRKAAATIHSAMTLSRTFVMENFHGLHARPAALLVRQIYQFQCEVTAECGGEIANAKSVLGLLALAAGAKSKLTFAATGPDAPQALEAIRHLFQTRFDEA